MSDKKEEKFNSVISSMKLSGFVFTDEELEKIRQFIEMDAEDQNKTIQETIERFIRKE